MIAHTAFISVIVAGGLCVAGPATTQSTQSTNTTDAERAIELAATVRQLGDYTVVSEAPIGRVVVLGLDHGMLTLRTTIRPTPSITQIHLTDVPGLNALNVRQMKGGGAAPSADSKEPFAPDFFMFTHYDFADPNWTESALNVALTPMNLQLAVDSESPTFTRNISLMQSNGALTNGEPSVRLHVNVSAKNGDTPVVNLDLIASDFTTLRRKYPDDCTQYLEPILHTLHADAVVFSPDAKLIWQVFATDVPADPATATSVKSIIARFDADDYHDRKTAADDLSKLGEPAALALMRTDRTTLSPEQSSRVDSFLAPYQPVSAAEAKRLGGDVNFLIDCLFDRDPVAVHDALVRLRRVTKQPIEFDEAQPVDARRRPIAELRRRLAPTTRPLP